MKKSTWHRVALSLLLLPCLAACGGGGDSAPASTSGTLDASFAKGGNLIAKFDDKKNITFDKSVTINGRKITLPAKMIIQPVDGKFLALGTVVNGTSRESVLLRFTADGRVDQSFGTDGIVSTPGLLLYGVAVQPSDGRILLAGHSIHGSDYDIDILRLLPADGSRDTTWGTVGQVTIQRSGTNEYAFAVAVQESDGKVVVTGSAPDDARFNNNFLVARLNPDGTLDGTFGVGGISRTAVPTGSGQKVSAEADRIAFQGDGIVIAGTVFRNVSSNVSAVVRYDKNGSLDTSFGTGGSITKSASTTGLLVQQDGMICHGTDYRIYRYDTSGALDQSFADKGSLSLVSVSNNVIYTTRISDLALDSKGRLVIAGDYIITTAGGMMPYGREILRYEPNGRDKSLDVLTFTISYDRAFSVAVQKNDDKIVMAGSTDDQSLVGTLGNLVLLRFLP